jgi:hypothetical protein
MRHGAERLHKDNQQITPVSDNEPWDKPWSHEVGRLIKAE